MNSRALSQRFIVCCLIWAWSCAKNGAMQGLAPTVKRPISHLPKQQCCKSARAARLLAREPSALIAVISSARTFITGSSNQTRTLDAAFEAYLAEAVTRLAAALLTVALLTVALLTVAHPQAAKTWSAVYFFRVEKSFSCMCIALWQKTSAKTFVLADVYVSAKRLLSPSISFWLHLSKSSRQRGTASRSD